MSTVEPGLRERKKARTRNAIVRAALELTLERGFAAATIQQIAERAEVAPRTVSLYFPHKDDIVFGGGDAAIDRLVGRLATGDGDLVARIRTWLTDEAEHMGEDDLELLYARSVAADEHLRTRERVLLENAEARIAAAVADELGEPSGGMGPRTFAAATLAVLLSVRDAVIAGTSEADAEAELERGLAFLVGGLAALRRPARPPAAG